MNAAQAVGHYDLFLFDLDGTLISSYMENEDKDYHTWEVLPGREQVIKALRDDQNKRVAIVTNQGAVAYGYVTEEDFVRKYVQVTEILGTMDMFFCYAMPGGQRTREEAAKQPDNPAWDVHRRKPSAKMLLEAMALAGVTQDRTVYVGDMDTDEQAATNAGVDNIKAEDFFA